jgi:hypothetical protein
MLEDDPMMIEMGKRLSKAFQALGAFDLVPKGAPVGIGAQGARVRAQGVGLLPPLASSPIRGPQEALSKGR